MKNLAFALLLPSLLIGLLQAGCADDEDRCKRRPWECAAGGGASTCQGVSNTAGAAGSAVAPSCAAYVPPPLADLAENPKLPDPFLSVDGTRISSGAEWACRRQEIKAQARTYELGSEAGAPECVTGALEGDSVKVTVTNAGKSGSFNATIKYPSTGSGPFPAMIGIGGVSIGADVLNSLGVATIVFPNDVLAEQKDGNSRGKGLFYTLNPTSSDTGAMMAWAWGVGRLIDALGALPNARIDTKHLGVTGCSRNGKGALVVGAFEERIVLTIPQESGSGGSASWRISDAMVAGGTQVQTLDEINGENVWFAPQFRQFIGKTNKLPFDHHMIEGLVAPRALLVIENTSQVWLGNQSTYNNSMAAHLIWEALGIPDRMGVSQVGDHSHCQWNGSQQSEVTAYVKKFLLEAADADDTNILKTDAAYAFDRDQWVDWSVPSL